MTDFTMSSTDDVNEWDFKVVDGECAFVTGDNGDSQGAGIAVFQEFGTVPQLPTAGVPWTGLILGEKLFIEIDAYITSALRNAGLSQFRAKYATVNGKLDVTVVR